MRDYLLMLRLDLNQAKNYIVEIRRNPKKLITYGLFALWVVLVVFPAFGNRRTVFTQGKDLIVAGYALVVIGLVFWAGFSALKRPAFSFNMGDVNLLFPSPLAPNRILFWNMLTKIPATLAKSALLLLFVTPSLINFGVWGINLFFVYLSVAAIALLLPSLSFLIFLGAKRYGRIKGIEGLLGLSLVWIVGSWLSVLWPTFNLSNLAFGYQVPGIRYFPIISWIVEPVKVALTGQAGGTYPSLMLLLLTIVLVDYLVFHLAEDYYEDVIEFSAKMEKARAAKRKGGAWQALDLSRFLRRGREVALKPRYLGSGAFWFKQVVWQRRYGFNEYLGYLSLAAALAGLAIGGFANWRNVDVRGLLFTVNGVILYILILRTTISPVNSELALPYIYTLPGSFLRKMLAINVLPIMRFAFNIFLLNLFLVVASGERIWLNAASLSLLTLSVYYELTNLTSLAYAILPSSLDRKIFYPLLVFLQLLLTALTAAAGGAAGYFLGGGDRMIEVGIILAEVIVGTLILLLSDKIYAYIEMREFAD